MFYDEKIQFEQKVRVITFVSLVSLVSSTCKAKMQATSPKENVQEISSAKSLQQNSQKGPNWKLYLDFFC